MMTVPLWLVAIATVLYGWILLYVVPRYSFAWHLFVLPLRNALHRFTAPLRRLGEWLFGWFEGLGVIDEIRCDCGRHSVRRVVTMAPSDELAVRRSLCVVCDVCGAAATRPSEPRVLDSSRSRFAGCSHQRADRVRDVSRSTGCPSSPAVTGARGVA